MYDDKIFTSFMLNNYSNISNYISKIIQTLKKYIWIKMLPK